MPATASVRDLRNRFPAIRKLLRKDGEVLLTERGTAKYRLTSYNSPPRKQAPAVNYWRRLTAYQPVSLTAEQARTLAEENRGDR